MAAEPGGTAQADDRIFGGKSLLQLCVDRIKPIFDLQNIIIVTNQQYVDVVRGHLNDIPSENILAEPIGRDTANAIGLAAAIIAKKDPTGIMAVFGSDQIIEPAEHLQSVIKRGLDFITQKPQASVTFAIRPDSPHTGFDYLKRGSASEIDSEVFQVSEFKEKPDLETAKQYLKSGQYSWNSGMFAWRVDTINNLIKEHLPDNAVGLAKIADAWQANDYQNVLESEFADLKKISIDFGVMEKAKDVYVCELDCIWKDVGSYQTLAEAVATPDSSGNHVTDSTYCELLDSSDNIIISEESGHAVVAIDVDGLAIVHTENATLICKKDQTDKLKKILENLKEKYK